MRIPKLHLPLLCATVLASPLARAEEAQGLIVSVRAGLILPGPGQIYTDHGAYSRVKDYGWGRVERVDFGWIETETGVGIGGTVSTRLSPGFSVSGIANYFSTSGANYGGDISILNLSASGKLHFDVSESMEFRLGVAVGINRVGFSDDGPGDPKVGLNVGPVFELTFPALESAQGLVELSAISQPLASDDDGTFPPIIYLMGGLEFGG